MRVLFIHTTKVIEYKGELYTNGSYNKEIWERYYMISENLTVLLRKSNIKLDYKTLNEKYNRIPSKITFIENPNLNNSFKDFLNIKKRLKKYRDLKKIIEDFDFIIIRLPGETSAVKICRKMKKKYLVELVGSPFYALWYHSLKGKLYSVYSYLSTKYEIKKSQNVLYVTKKYLQSKYPNTNHSIGITDVNLEGIVIDNKFINEKINQFSINKKIATIGNVDLRYKGQKYVIKCLKILKEKFNICVDYYLIGGGDSKKLIKYSKKMNVKNQVHFLGYLNHEGTINFLNNINIYVQPSLTEGLPRSLMEAMKSGNVCFGTNVGGIAELLPERCLINKNSNIGKILAEKIINLSDVEYKKIIKENFKTLEKYDNNNMNFERIKFYNEIKEE